MGGEGEGGGEGRGLSEYFDLRFFDFALGHIGRERAKKRSEASQRCMYLFIICKISPSLSSLPHSFPPSSLSTLLLLELSSRAGSQKENLKTSKHQYMINCIFVFCYICIYILYTYTPIFLGVVIDE